MTENALISFLHNYPWVATIWPIILVVGIIAFSVAFTFVTYFIGRFRK